LFHKISVETNPEKEQVTKLYIYSKQKYIFIYLL